MEGAKNSKKIIGHTSAGWALPRALVCSELQFELQRRNQHQSDISISIVGFAISISHGRISISISHGRITRRESLAVRRQAPPSPRPLRHTASPARRRACVSWGSLAWALGVGSSRMGRPWPRAKARPRPVVAQAARLTGAHVRAQAHRAELRRPRVGSCEVCGPRSVASACGLLCAGRGTGLLGAHGVPVVGWQVLDGEREDVHVW